MDQGENEFYAYEKDIIYTVHRARRFLGNGKRSGNLNGIRQDSLWQPFRTAPAAR